MIKDGQSAEDKDSTDSSSSSDDDDQAKPKTKVDKDAKDNFDEDKESKGKRTTEGSQVCEHIGSHVFVVKLFFYIIGGKKE